MSLDTSAQSKPLKAILGFVSLVLLLWLSLPTLYLFVWSLTGTNNVGILGEFTFRWYRSILTSPEWRYAFAYSLLIACVSSGAGIVASTLYFYFSLWYRRFYQSLGFLLLMGPLFLPTVVYALALRLTFNANGWPEWVPLLVGNVVLLFPVQYLLLESANELIKIEWVFGAASMGASHSEILWRIVRPVLRKVLLSSFGIGFLLSFDETVVAVFVIDSANATIPKRMWDAISRDMDPSPAVISVLMLLCACATSVFFRLVSRRRTL